MSAIENIRALIDPPTSVTLDRLKEIREKMGDRCIVAHSSTFVPSNVDGSAILTAFKAQRIIERMGK